jgi:hypothetical protein
VNNAIASMMRVRPNVGGTSYTSPTSDGILGTRVTRPSENRIRVYWQTQGSGKSFTNGSPMAVSPGNSRVQAITALLTEAREVNGPVSRDRQ